MFFLKSKVHYHNYKHSVQTAFFEQVGSSLCDCFPRAGLENYLYILLMEEANSPTRNFMFSKEPPEGPHHGVGILTQKPIPHNQVCQ